VKETVSHFHSGCELVDSSSLHGAAAAALRERRRRKRGRRDLDLPRRRPAASTNDHEKKVEGLGKS
jgi:hypothetical protein